MKDEMVAILRKENAILRRALEWYANPKNWHSNIGYPKNTTVCDPDYGNPGGKARRALERVRKVKPAKERSDVEANRG